MVRSFLQRVCVFLVCLTATAMATAAVEPGKKVVYKESGGIRCEMEIYVPPQHDPKQHPVPGVILFHGGGWRGGSLSQFREACQYLASRGLVAATVEYRMHRSRTPDSLPAGESIKRLCITDAKSAIRWIKKNAAELGIDPKRLIVGGGSAGGHIAMLATTNPGLNDPADPAGYDTSVVAYLLFNPAFSPEDSKDPEVDVLRHLQPGTAPAIVFFGSEDRDWFPGYQPVQRRLKDQGGKLEVWIADGQSHGFFNSAPWQNLTLAAADRFLVSLGLLKGEPTVAPPAGNEKLTAAP